MERDLMNLANLAGSGDWKLFQAEYQAFMDAHFKHDKHGEILPSNVPSVTVRRLNKINAYAVVHCN